MRGSWYFLVPFLCTLWAPCALFSSIYLYTAFYRSKKKKPELMSDMVELYSASDPVVIYTESTNVGIHKASP